jgi:hypothetical protein
MGHILFDRTLPLITLRLRVGGVNENDFQAVPVALDTGASITTIPIQVDTDLGYDTKLT